MPKDSPGLSFGANEVKMGWNAQPTRQVIDRFGRKHVGSRHHDVVARQASGIARSITLSDNAVGRSGIEPWTVTGVEGRRTVNRRQLDGEGRSGLSLGCQSNIRLHR